MIMITHLVALLSAFLIVMYQLTYIPCIPYAHSVRMHVYQFAQNCLVNKGGVLIYKIQNPSSG